METVAEFKRAIRPGVRLTMVGTPALGWLNGTTREVVRVQSARFSLRTTTPDGSEVESWVTFPKSADLVKTPEPGRVSFLRSSGEPEYGTMTYEIVS